MLRKCYGKFKLQIYLHNFRADRDLSFSFYRRDIKRIQNSPQIYTQQKTQKAHIK